ncbi:MAG: MG2 domain-containing protein [Armatimonadota bacterium]
MTGKVVEASGKPVPNALVVISSYNERTGEYFSAKTRADSHGRFVLAGIPAGKHNISPHSPGFAAAEVQEVAVKEGKNAPLILRMTERPPEVYVGFTAREFLAGRRPRIQVNGAVRPPAEVRLSVFRVDMLSYLRSPKGLSVLDANRPFSGRPLAEWSVRIENTDDDGYFYRSTEVPVSSPGGYVVGASLGRVYRRFWILVTPLGLVVKSAPGRALVYAVDLARGVPTPGAEVEAWSAGHLLWKGVTGPDGTVQWDRADLGGSVTFIAQKRGGIAFVYSGGAAPSEYRCYIYTDRPVYRPGQKVYFRGILRRKQLQGYETPSGKPVYVEVKDEGDNTIASMNLTTSEFGTFWGEAALDPNAAPGNYSINVSALGEKHSASFEVQEYRKPEYFVEVSFPRKYYLAGQTVQADVKAEYYFGAPVVGAKVVYIVRRQPYWIWEPEDPAEVFFGEEIGPGSEEYGWYPSGYGEFLLEGEAATDANGRLTVRIPAERLDTPQLYTIEAQVTDVSGRTVTGVGHIPVSPSMLRLSVQPERWLCQPGVPMIVRIRAEDLEGHPARGRRVDVHTESVTWEKNEEKFRHVATAGAVTNAEGTAEVRLPPLASGTYRVLATARDASGALAKSETRIWVADEAGIPFPSPYELELVRDRNFYRPGDTAKVLIRSRARGAYALVALEGRDLFNYQVVRLTGSNVIEVPLERVHMPGVYLNVCVGTKDGFILRNMSLYISPADQLLNVQITPDRTKYHPGETATYRLMVTDFQGKPVKAELSLGVVDEAVYAVRSERAEDIRRFFHGTVESVVFTSTSMSEYYSAGANKMGMEDRTRRYFPDTAFWSPSIVTDENGTAVVSFTMPDSLTSWRATARAVTLDTKVGSAVISVVCTKDLLVRPLLPRFFTERDRVLIGAAVHNYTRDKQRVRVVLRADGLSVQGAASTVVEVPPNGVQRVQWNVSPAATAAEKAKNLSPVRPFWSALVRVSAVGQGARDSVEMEIPVLPHGMELFASRAGEVDEQERFSLGIPQDALPYPRELKITLSPSVASAALGVLDSLRRYRYESAEGIMDVLLPDVVMLDALERLGIQKPAERERLYKLVRADLQRVYQLQRGDGGWGWWYYDPTDGWMSAYVLYGLLRARQAGFDVQKTVVESAVKAVREAVKREANFDKLSTMVYVLCLAGSPPWEQLRTLLSRTEHLQNYSVALLMLSLDAVGQKQRARALIPRLVRGAVQTPATCSWPETFPWGFYSCNEYETTGYALRALLKTDPGSPLIPKAVRWLMLRRQGDRWSANYDTASVVYALADYLLTAERERPSCSVSVFVNGQPVRRVKFGPQDVYAPEVVLAVPPGVLKAGANFITLTKNGTGRVFYTAQLRWYSGTENIPPRAGLVNIRRSYWRLVASKNVDGTISYVPRPLDGRVGPGDLIQVRLDVISPREAQYLVVNDHIPSGFEPVGTLEAERGSAAYMREGWDYWWAGQQFRDESATFYLRSVRRGKQTITYTLRPGLAGEFHVLPARVSGLYEPDLSAHTAEARLRVLPR